MTREKWEEDNYVELYDAWCDSDVRLFSEFKNKMWELRIDHLNEIAIDEYLMKRNFDEKIN